MKKAKRFLSYGFLFSISLFVFSSCEKDSDSETEDTRSLRIEIDTKIAGEDFKINEVYKDYKDRDFRIELLKFYMNTMMVVDVGGNEVLLKDIALYNASMDGVLSITVDDVPAGTYTTFKTGLGLSSEINALNPADYESSHPLSLDNQMYWGWASKFKFVVVEGRVDAGTGSIESIFAYHSGTDDLYRNMEVDIQDFEVKETGISVLKINVNVDEMFQGNGGTLDFVDENSSHTTSNIEYVIKLTDNMINAFYR